MLLSSRNALTSYVNGVEFVKALLHTSIFKLNYLYSMVSFFIHLIYFPLIYLILTIWYDFGLANTISEKGCPNPPFL